MSHGGTPFAETEALLAVLDGDEDLAEAIVRHMLPGERQALARASIVLSDICESRCIVCDECVTLGGPRGNVATYVGGFGSGGPRLLHQATCPLPNGGSA